MDERVLIRNVKVVSPGTETTVRDVLMAGGRWSFPAQAPDGVRVVDGSGKILLPGLYDMRTCASLAGRTAKPSPPPARRPWRVDSRA